MKDLLLVFIGGGFGSVTRFLFSKWLNPVMSSFFLGTFTANVISCLILGLITGVVGMKILPENVAKPLLLIGFCGGFSTFSTFTNELINLGKTDQMLLPGIYLILSIVAGVGGVLAGLWLSKFC